MAKNEDKTPVTEDETVHTTESKDYAKDPGVTGAEEDSALTDERDYSDDTEEAPSRKERAKGVPEDSIVPGSTTSLPPSNTIETGQSGVSDDAPKYEKPEGALKEAPELHGPTPVTPAKSANKDEGPVLAEPERIVPSTDGPPPAEQTISQDTSAPSSDSSSSSS